MSDARNMGEEQAVAHVEAALAYFAALPTNANPVAQAVFGLDLFGEAAFRHPELTVTAAHLAQKSNAVLFEAAPIIASATAGSIVPEKVYSGLGMAASLLTAPPDGFREDRMLYVALFITELRAFLYRAELSRRNDPLGRAMAARRAWEAAEPETSAVN